MSNVAMNAFMVGDENECPKAKKPPRLLSHCTVKLVKVDIS